MSMSALQQRLLLPLRREVFSFAVSTGKIVSSQLHSRSIAAVLSCSILLRSAFHSSVSGTLNMPIKVGDKLPSAELYENSPANKVNILDLCAGKKVVLFAVPGAFTPGCSKTHLPGYIKEADKLKSHGLGEIICVAVNDPFVMAAWAKEQGAEGKVRLLADPLANFTKAMELQTDIPPLGGVRSKRYSMLVDDCVVKALNVEPDGTGLSCSLASNLKIQ